MPKNFFLAHGISPISKPLFQLRSYCLYRSANVSTILLDRFTIISRSWKKLHCVFIMFRAILPLSRRIRNMPLSIRVRDSGDESGLGQYFYRSVNIGTAFNLAGFHTFYLLVWSLQTAFSSLIFSSTIDGYKGSGPLSRTRRLGGPDFFPTDKFPIGVASRISAKPSSQQQGTRDLPDKGNIFFRQHPQQLTPQVLKTPWQTAACVMFKLFHFHSFFKKISWGGTPTSSHGDAPANGERQKHYGTTITM